MARILVIDDEEDIVFIVKKILTGAGHEVMGVTSGREALDTMKNKQPDLILLDVMMPGLDGWQTLELIRNEESFKDIPVSMLTAKAMTPKIAKRDEIEELVDYIEKPFTKESLIKRVNYEIIEDLDSIAEKTSKLTRAVEDDEKLATYKTAARLERLHNNILSMLKKNIERANPGEWGDIKAAIDSQKQSVKVFRTLQEEIEALDNKSVVA